MRKILLSLMVLIYSIIGISQINHDFEAELSCSHVKSQIGHDFGRYLYNWQSEYMDDYDVTFYHLDIEITNTSTFVEGNSTLHANALVDIDTFAIELKSFQTITQLLVNGVTYTNYTRDGDNVIVPVNMISAGSNFTAQIYYYGEPPSGGFFSGVTNKTSGQWGKQVTWTLSEPFAASDWFPVKQDLEDKADSVWVFLTTDSTNMAGSQGILTDVVDLGNGKLRYEWKSNYPIDYYLISFAVADYQEYNIYAFPDELDGDSVLIQNFVYDSPGCLETYKNGIDETAPMIDLFSDLFILYPFWEEKYGHCLTELGGGMEHQTMSTMGGFSFGLVSHELGHMWFGDNVTCATWSDIWINEGFATYSNYLAEEYLHGWSSGENFIKGAQDYAMSAPGGSVYIPEDQIYPGNEGRIFSGRLSYYKGASIIHMLRHEINDDDLFFNVLETFQTDFTDSTATGDDFRNVAEDVTGMDFEDFFDQWYYGEGYPRYSIEYYNLSGKIHFSILQTPSSTTPFFEQHMDMQLYFDDNSDTLISFHQNENLIEFEIDLDKNIIYIDVDPMQWNMEKVTSISVAVEENITPVNFKLGQDNINDRVTLYFNNHELKSKLINITDITGKVVYSGNTEESEFAIRTSNLTNGVYIVSASNGKETYVQRFVK